MDVGWYAHEKRRREREGEEGGPAWPSKKLMGAELVMAVVLVLSFFSTISQVMYPWHRYEEPFSWYANLALLVSG